MQLKKYFPILFLLLIVFSACNKILNTVPQDFIAPETYYKTTEEVNAALMGVYDALGQNGTYARNLALELPLATDEGLCRSSTGVLPYFYNYDPADANVLNCWKSLYLGIERANLLLAKIDGSGIADTAKTEIKGETLFLRAYYYFVLTSYWGDVPLKLTSANNVSQVNIAATLSKDVYAQIIKDMIQAEGMVNEITTWGYGGRVSKSAVQGMLARVYLYAAGRLNDASFYTQALTWAQKVISSGKHSLNPDYTQVFINYLQDKYDIKESIWEVEFYGNNVGTTYNETEGFAANYGATNTDTDPAGYSYGLIISTAKLYNAYATGDVRRDWIICPWTYSGNKGTVHANYPATNKWRYIGKYRRELQTITPKAKNFGNTNFPLMRYADVLLMFAEAENQVNGPTAAAYDAINQVRRRAMGKPATTPNATVDLATGLDKTGFFNAVKDERFRELAFEGLRKQDLIRWGIFLQTMKDEVTDVMTNGVTSGSGWPGIPIIAQTYQNVSERHLLLPIPAAEMSLNQSISQNPNW